MERDGKQRIWGGAALLVLALVVAALVWRYGIHREPPTPPPPLRPGVEQG